MKYCLIIITGGTIDSSPYSTTPHDIAPLKISLVPQTVEELGLAKQVRFLQWSMKDSKHFEDEELKALTKVIAQSESDYIVVTHGTDRMPENSRRLAELLKGTIKTVILTGSMEPLSHGRERSDGFENLRVAITGCRAKHAGVHVVMHGRWFNPAGLRKNRESKTFYNDLDCLAEAH